MLKNNHKGRLTRNSLLGPVLCPYCSPWYIICRRISPIKLCNPSLADPEVATPSLQYPPPPQFFLLTWALIFSRKHHFKPCILTFFWRSMTPDPCKAHKRRNVPAVVCIRNYSEKLASIAESTTAHHNEMSANAYFIPRAMYTCVLQANVLIRGVVVLDVRWVVPNC